MCALSVSAEGDCYLCVPPDPGIATASLGASKSGTLPGTAPAHAFHTFTLDSSSSACFFRDSTTLTPLSTPVPIRLANPSGGPVVARSSTDLPCPAVPSGSPAGLYLPSFSTNLVSTAALQDAMVTTTTPGDSSVAHRLGRPSLPRLRGMHSRLLISGLPTSLPPLPPLLAPPCLPCVERRQRAAPHSSSFPPMTAPLQTLHMDVWGPARDSRQGRERFFLIVVDDYTRYTTDFPLRSKGEVVEFLIPWIRTVRLQLRERFGEDLPVLRLHSDRGGEFSSNLRDFCRGEGILQSFTLPDSPQKNGIAKHRIGLVMEVARTSMIHAAAPHFQWPFAVRYAAHQLNLWPHTSANKHSTRAIPCVFLGFVPDAPGWQFYHPTLRRVLPSQDVTFDESVPFYGLFPYRSAPPPPPPLFLAPGPPPVDPLPPQGPAPSGVSPVDPLPGTAPVEGAGSGDAEPGGEEPGGAEPEGVEPGGAESEGAESGGAEPRGVALSGGPASASPRLSPQQLREWLVRHAHLRSGATGARGGGDAGAGGAGVTAGSGGAGGTAAAGPAGARTRGAGAAETDGVGGAGAGNPTEPRTTGAGGSCTDGAGAGGAGVGGTGAGGARAAGAGAVDPGAGGAGGTVRPRQNFVPLLQQVLGVPSSPRLTPPLLCPPPDQSQPPLLSASPLPVPSPSTEQSRSLTERREPASRPVSPVRTARCFPHSRPPPVPGTHAMALRPSSVPLRVPVPTPSESSLPAVLDPQSDHARAASPTVSRLLATSVIDPSFESPAVSALVAELLDFAVLKYYATALVSESASASHPSIGGECALGTDVFEDRQEDFECLAAALPRFASMLLAPEGDPDAPDIPTRALTQRRSRVLTPLIGRQPWMPRWHPRIPLAPTVKRPPGSPPAFKARYVAQGFSQRQGVDYFQTFSPTPKMTTLRVLLHVAVQRDYELHSLDFSTPFLQGSLHEEIWTTLAALGFAPSTADPSQFLRTDTSLPPFYVLVYVDDLVFATANTEALVKSELQKRHTCADLGELRSYVLQRFGFQFSSPYPTPLSTGHLLSAPPSDESVEPSGLYPELVGCLMYLMTCTRPDLAYPLSLLARYVALGRHRKVHWDAARRVLLYLCSTSGIGLVLGGRGPVVLTGHVDASSVDESATQRSSCCEAEIYAGAMAAQELHWLTYVLTDLGEQPHSPPVLYVDNKAMIALRQEHRREHITKHIALRYFLARELQQRGQVHLAYVATRANTADIFTKALPPGDHQCFSTVLGL
ncbi:unnamed protein product, partial [Closterium sp. NIES-53]